MLSGLTAEYHPKHKQRIHNEFVEYKQTGTIIKIPVKDLNSILREHNLYTIDLLAIDVEGAEEKIITSIDYDTFYIRYIMVENNYHDTTMAEHLAKYGYRFIQRLDIDDIYERITENAS